MSTTERPSHEHDLPSHEGEHLPQPHAVAGEGVEVAEEEATGSHWSRLVGLGAFVVGIGVIFGLPLLIVILALAVCIFLHELGHYLTAKSAGMKVTEFFLGFGPRIWSFQRGETEYGIKVIPAGAYVRIIGMNNLDEVPPEDESRTYRQKSYWRRMSVAVAGSTMHFLIALVLLWTLLVFFGRPAGTDEWVIDQISDGESVTESVEYYDPGVSEASNQALIDRFAAGESPAQQAGLEEGDRIVAIDDQAVDTFSEMSETVRELPGETVTLTVERGDETFETTTQLGAITNDESTGGFLGIGAERPTVTEQPLAAVPESFSLFGEMVVGSVEGIGQVFTPSGLANIWDQVSGGIAGEDEDAAVPSPADGRSASIEEDRAVSIIGAATLGAQLTEAGLENLVAFLALLNIFIGVFNLIPLLPFDGGHVAVGTYEKVRELLSGERRYQADVSKLLPLTYGVVVVLVSFGALLMMNDIVNPPEL